MKFDQNEIKKFVHTAGSDSVDVWVYRIPTFINETDLYKSLSKLTGNEVGAGFRFHFAADRIRHFVTRLLVREILGSYISREPRELAFESTSFGKPRLLGEKQIEFNVSHTNGAIVIAVNWKNNVGVDIVEYSASKFDYLDAMFLFSQEERKYVMSEVAAGRNERFARIWSLKEAYVKSTGEGLSRSVAELSFRIEETIKFTGPRLGPLFSKSPSMFWQFIVFPRTVISVCTVANDFDNYKFRAIEINCDENLSTCRDITNSLKIVTSMPKN